MSAEQTCLLPSVAEEKLKAAEGILQRFLDWHKGGCPFNKERLEVRWFAHEVRQYFETGCDWEAA